MKSEIETMFAQSLRRVAQASTAVSSRASTTPAAHTLSSRTLYGATSRTLQQCRFQTTASSTTASAQPNKPAATASDGASGVKQEEAKSSESSPNINDFLALSPAAILGILEKLGKETATKMNLKEPMDNLSLGLSRAGSGSADQAVAFLTCYLQLSRGHMLSDEELDKHLQGFFPSQVVELIKEKKKEIPPDPVLTKLDTLEEKISTLEATILKLESAVAQKKP